MPTYLITATVETMDHRIGNARSQSEITVPPFYVVAASTAEAEKLAGEVIDPVQMTGVRVTAREARIPGMGELREDLDLAVEALNSASASGAEARNALMQLAQDTACLMGLDWGELTRPYRDDDDERTDDE